MDRIGEYFVRHVGTKYKQAVWYDARGRFVTPYTSGTSDFVFHQRKVSACKTLIFLRCKHHTQLVLSVSKDIKGDLPKLAC